MADYLDWATDVLASGDTLRDHDIKAITASLGDQKTMKQFAGRLERKGITAVIEAGQVVVRRGGNTLAKFYTKRIAGRLVAGMAIGVNVYFVVEAAASGDTPEEALAQGMREMVAAELWEAGFHLTVISGCDIVYDRFIPSVASRPTARRILNSPGILPSEREAYIRDYQLKPFREIANDISPPSFLESLMFWK